MDVLILGLSSIVQRRVVPALRALASIERIDLATRKAADPEIKVGWPHGDVYADYADGLARSRAQLAYISLVNSEHEPWALQAVERGYHVIVDKPAFLGCARAEHALKLAERQGVCIAEATVFAYHPQVPFMRSIFADGGSSPTRITAIFSFPPMEPSNFRYRSALGGGAFWDVGPYAAALGRVFYGEEPEWVTSRVLGYGGPDNVETAFSILLAFSGGKSLVGHFGFDTVYRNCVEVIGPALSVALDRVFTTPPELANPVHITRPDGVSTVIAPAGDGFAAFLGHTAESISAGRWSGLAADLLADARTLQHLREAAGVD